VTPTTQMTKSQELRFYRNAVRVSLEQFYGKSRPEASRLVRDWWRRLSQSGAFHSELFLHAEPINTAAGIAEVRAIPITAKNRDAYHLILNQSRDLVLLHASLKATQIAPEPKKKDAKQDLIQSVVERTGLPRTKVEAAVDAIFDSMKQSLVSGDRIELRGFGVFTVKPRKTGIGQSPRTRAEVTIAPGKAVRYSRGKERHLLA
jgi:nucleoid DNA-binding protein